MADEYRRFWLTSSAALDRERLLAEAFEAGAEGAEEFEAEGRYRACVYAASDKVESILSALHRVVSLDAVIGDSELVPAVDWSEAWKDGLEAVRISSRLVVRPPFVEVELEPGQHEIVIEPAQAFGTGGHASTRLCLAGIDGLYAPASDRARYDRVLDVGTGSGVLALAALVLGAESALGFDLDPVAIREARACARGNGLADRVDFFVGPIEALGKVSGSYPLVVANLLKREIMPIASAVARCVGATGRLLLAGLLEEDAAQVLARFAEHGLFESAARRSQDDASGRWVGLCLARRP